MVATDTAGNETTTSTYFLARPWPYLLLAIPWFLNSTGLLVGAITGAVNQSGEAIAFFGIPGVVGLVGMWGTWELVSEAMRARRGEASARPPHRAAQFTSWDRKFFLVGVLAYVGALVAGVVLIAIFAGIGGSIGGFVMGITVLLAVLVVHITAASILTDYLREVRGVRKRVALAFGASLFAVGLLGPIIWAHSNRLSAKYDL